MFPVSVTRFYKAIKQLLRKKNVAFLNYNKLLGNSLHCVSLKTALKLGKEVNDYLLHSSLLWNKKKYIYCISFDV
jgi:hypothetical protein